MSACYCSSTHHPHCSNQQQHYRPPVNPLPYNCPQSQNLPQQQGTNRRILKRFLLLVFLQIPSLLSSWFSSHKLSLRAENAKWSSSSYMGSYFKMVSLIGMTSSLKPHSWMPHSSKFVFSPPVFSSKPKRQIIQVKLWKRCRDLKTNQRTFLMSKTLRLPCFMMLREKLSFAVLLRAIDLHFPLWALGEHLLAGIVFVSSQGSFSSCCPTALVEDKDSSFFSLVCFYGFIFFWVFFLFCFFPLHHHRSRHC